MGTYTSKYTGEQIDSLLEQVENEGGSGGGSGYSETVIFDNPTPMTEGGTYTLSDDITNYDRLMVESCCDSFAFISTKEILVSSIKYTTTGSASYRYDIRGNSTANYNVWYGIYFGFLDSKTLHVRNLTNQGFSSAKIYKIIGIKY